MHAERMEFEVRFWVLAVMASLMTFGPLSVRSGEAMIYGPALGLPVVFVGAAILSRRVRRSFFSGLSPAAAFGGLSMVFAWVQVVIFRDDITTARVIWVVTLWDIAVATVYSAHRWKASRAGQQRAL